MTTNPYESPERPSELPRQSRNWPKLTLRLFTIVGVIGLLAALALPNLRRCAREAARRMQCHSNLHNIALALQNYESMYRCLPPAYTVDADGKPLHSWRTLILPFVEQKALYETIDLNKPWDDPGNRRVHDTVLRLYECPSSTAERGMTTYLAVVAPGSCFQPIQSKSIAAVKDRRDRTLTVIEVSAQRAVHWMSPQDATEEMIVRRKADGKFSHPRGSQAAFADGHVEYLSEDVSAEALRAMISIDGNDDDRASEH